MEWLRFLISPAVSILILLIGGAVMFGKFKEKCDNNDKKIIKVEGSIMKRIENLENNNGAIMIECDKRFEMQKTLMCGKIESLEKIVIGTSEIAEKTRKELSRDIAKNRDEVLTKFDNISLFIGETRSIMNLLKTRIFEEN
jgi:hypothetical protein